MCVGRARCTAALRRLLFLVLAAGGSCVCAGQPATSAIPLPDPASARSTHPQGGALDLPLWTNEGRLNFGFQAAYGIQNPIPPNGSHINLVYSQPQLGVILRNFQRSPVSRLELLNEGMLGAGVHPRGRLLGYALLFRLEGRPHHNTTPLLDWGAGILNTTLNQRAYELAGGLQFSPQAGLGFEHYFSPQRAFVLEYRFLHMSNAGLREPNHGFNAAVLTIGFRWTRKRQS